MPDSNAVSPTANLLKGKRGLVMGVANNRSIAWGIAKAAADAGAELAFTYQGDALKKRVEPLAKELGGHVVGHCDVTDGATIDALRSAAAARGVPVRRNDEPLGAARRGVDWIRGQSSQVT